MKKNYLFFAILFNLYNPFVSGQICGTLPYSNDNQQQKLNSLKSSNNLYLNNSTSICINVKYHIVRQSNATGGFNISSLNNVNNRLNEAYNEHKIYFNNLGYDYINNSTYYNIDDVGNNTTEFDALVQISNDPNAINIYIVNSAVSYNGKANGILSKELVIDKSYAVTQVLSHELGHCLNLWHTFHGSLAEPASILDPNACAENTNGSNCQTCGDYVCDTPADGNVGNSNGYNPSFDNIMSYYFPFDSFTLGQNTRIRQAFASSSILQNVISNSCTIPKLNGSSIVCNSNTTFTLQNGGSSVTWQVSSNLQIVSSNNTSIIVKPLSTSTNGNGYIKAVLPHETLEKNLWIGTPNSDLIVYNNIGPYYPSNGNEIWNDFPNDGQLSYDGNEDDILEYEWDIVGWQVIQHPNDPFYTIPMKNVQIIGNPNNFSYLYVKVRARNKCGWSDYKHPVVRLKPISSGFSFSVYPNPTTETLNIEKQQNIKTYTFDKHIETSSDSYELYNFNSNLITTGNLSKQTSIDVSKFKKGRYILKITANGKSETHHILID